VPALEHAGRLVVDVFAGVGGAGRENGERSHVVCPWQRLGSSGAVSNDAEDERERRPDSDAPGNFVDDREADEVPEPNEPA
jgi:hypothetical protein